jgi:hypothetical protein
LRALHHPYMPLCRLATCRELDMKLVEWQLLNRVVDRLFKPPSLAKWKLSPMLVAGFVVNCWCLFVQFWLSFYVYGAVQQAVTPGYQGRSSRKGQAISIKSRYAQIRGQMSRQIPRLLVRIPGASRGRVSERLQCLRMGWRKGVYVQKWGKLQ